MGQDMNKLLLRAALLSCAALAVGPAMATHAWGNYHWARKTNPLNLRLERQLSTSQWVSAFTTAEADWDKSTVLNLTPASTNLGVNARYCTAVTGKALVCNSAYGQRGWLGIATIWLDSRGHITKGTTKLNDSYHNYPPYNTTAWRALVTCQEIGHIFGLAHQDENFSNPNLNTCMDYTNSPTSNQHPNSHDYSQLTSIYSHLDSYMTASTSVTTNFGIRAVGGPSAAPAASEDDPGDSPPEWGSAVHHDGKGRPDIFVKNLSRGQKKITHVFWAIDEGPQGQQHHREK